MSFSVRLVRLAACALLAASFAGPASAIVLLDDLAGDNGDRDYRPGKLLPTVAQLGAVKRLQARATWNRFGTVSTLVRHGGYLATGYSGAPGDAARAFVRDHRDLFRLSAASAAALEVVNTGDMPYSNAHAVLLRQRFGGLMPTLEGLITVGIVDGKIYWASSSSVGDQPMPGAATLAPLQAWLKAAANVHRRVVDADVLQNHDRTAEQGWHLFQVRGFSEPQRARLVAVPMPAGGVRQAWETLVIDNTGGLPTAFVHWIDGETGAILRRQNHVFHQAGGLPIPQTYTGTFPDAGQCAERHEFAVGEGNAALQVTLAAVQPADAVTLKLFFANADGSSTLVAQPPPTTGPFEFLNYAPTNGVPAGTYQVEACSAEAFSPLPPYNYVGTFTASPVDFISTTPFNGADANAPAWKWFPATPLMDYAGADIRKILCFANPPGATLGACDIDVGSAATRAPWDTLLGGVIPTFTTIGNNAITAGDSLSPLTPSIPNLAFSPLRKYDYAFNNAWAGSKCDPVNILQSQVAQLNGNDIAAVSANLFVSHNRMHDFSYNLGFTERNYNLQLYNFGLTPVTQQNDPEVGQVQAGSLGGMPALPTFGTLPGRDNANQIAVMDGVPGITNQYLFQPVAGVIYSPCADGSLDMGIVGHEYTHAISNRMVAGPDGSLSGHQPGSMGESWGDLTATEFQLAYGYLPLPGYRATALAAYTTGNPDHGIRNYALDDSPLNFSNMGFDTPGPEVHSDGEIWNAVQWDLRHALVDKYQAVYDATDPALQKACADGVRAPENCPGNRQWIQLVFDAFLLMQSGVSMLDARDAMLAADVARFGGANQAEMWRVFARRGMGQHAYTADGEDVAPIPSFESPLADDHAEVTFTVKALDELDGAVVARILVGDYSIRSRQIADTDPLTEPLPADPELTPGLVVDPATLNTLETARLVPGTYRLTVVAPGYGIHQFTRELKAGSNAITFRLPSNWASVAKGASAVVTATGVVDQVGGLINPAPQPIDGILLLDDSEDTGTLVGDGGNIEGSYALITLAGGAHEISQVNVSMAAGPTNAGRWGAVRKFEIRTCNGECSDPDADFANIAYTSPDDAFPGGIPRPLQPDLKLRTFTFPPVVATHVQFRVLTTQCTGGPAYQGDVDADPTNDTHCPTARGLISGLNLVLGGDVIVPAPGSYSRATEIQVFTRGPEETAVVKELVPVAAPADGNRFGGGLPLVSVLVLLLGVARRRG